MFTCTDILTCAMAYAPAIFDLAFAVVAVASAVAALTPSPKDDKLVGRLRGLLDMLALNVGHAKPTKR